MKMNSSNERTPFNVRSPFHPSSRKENLTEYRSKFIDSEEKSKDKQNSLKNKENLIYFKTSPYEKVMDKCFLAESIQKINKQIDYYNLKSSRDFNVCSSN